MLAREEFMRRPMLLATLLIVAAILTAAGSWVARTNAQDATPTSAGTVRLVFVEHNDAMTDILQSKLGGSVGDLRVWGPNALYDEANATDTGATTQGTCVAYNPNFDCLADETIVFPDGSTLEIQGIQLGGAQPSMRTIVGGSGQYLGATGTVAVAPTSDLSHWTKTLEISGLSAAE
jgi:3D (Asp-Asp-Asp) domain-containing protein